MKFLKFHEFLDRGGMLCPWGQNMGFWAVLANIMSKHVSRVGTHRSNEWEGRHGVVFDIHAARDDKKNKDSDKVKINNRL
jgi:hypothetical protein